MDGISQFDGVLGSPPQQAPVAALDAVFLQQKDGPILSNYGVDHRNVNQALQVSSVYRFLFRPQY
jgi:hypothetical protein